jgi:RNA polymerase sigma factor (sigma-70 family)
MPESVVSWEDEFDVADDRELVSRLFGVLDERSQRLVIMKYHDGMRNIDIAQELGMNPSTVASALSRAVAKMREAYEGSM